MPGVAVIVIDMQQGLLAGDGTPAYPEAHRVPEVVAGINRLTRAARASGALVSFVQHEDEELVLNSPAWSLDEGLERDARDLMIGKRHGDSFHETPLRDELAGRGVERLILCGYATEYCVNTAARRAVSIGYETTVVSDLHTTQAQPSLSAELIVAHHNHVWMTSSLAGNRIAVRTLDDVLRTEFT
ncbi:isochorismatase family protein [Trinickia fusca]|uniref:Isochorismatase family protein n=1 Tax=Trinickia fusca TaxID=2419777 RepID=A0A494X6Q8_9BURK|nr:isochorismatase family protein [Trinickia fusca]RKP43956.1 isochorismatase family protein [Trinickia fusca]